MPRAGRAAAAALVAAAQLHACALLAPAGTPFVTDYRAFLAVTNASQLPKAPGPPLALHWQAPFLSGGGYCSEATAFMFGLADGTGSGIPLSIEQHGDSYSAGYVGGLPYQDQIRLGNLLAGGHGAPPRRAVDVCHSEPGAWHLPPANPQRYSTSVCPRPGAAVAVGRTMFETDRTPAGWAARLNAMDEVWVPSAFQRDVFAAGGVDPAKLLVLPEAVDTEFFDPARFAPPGGGGGGGGAWPLGADHTDAAAMEGHGLPARRCPPGATPGASPECPLRFLSVGKFERRKGFDVLLRAFLREFGAAAPPAGGGGGGSAPPVYAELAILTSAYHSTADFDGAVARMVSEQLECRPAAAGGEAGAAGGGGFHDDGDCVPPAAWAARPPVRLLRDVPQALLPAVYALSDAFVLASRGEGWGRPHVEAMAMGMPVIATAWSGPSEFMTPANSYPLRHAGLAPIPDGPFAGHLQAEPDVGHLRELLREVARDPAAARARGAVARADMVRLYSPRALGAFLAHQVHRLSAAVAERGGAAARGGRGRGDGEL